MKKYFSVIAAFGAVLAASCNKAGFDEKTPAEPSVPGDLVEMTFSATKEEAGETSKAFFHDGWKTQWWAADDAVSVFPGNTKAVNTLPEGPNASFSGSVTPGETHIVLYPYDAAATCDMTARTITTTLPASQKISGSYSCDPAALIAAGITDGSDVAMNNYFSIVKVDITAEDIASVTIESRGDEPVAGTLTIGLEDNTASILSNPSSRVTLLPADKTFVPGSYGLVIAPVAFESGFRVIVKRSGSPRAAIKTKAAQTVTRNNGINVGELTLQDTDFVNYYIFTKADLDAWDNDGANWTTSDKVYLGADIDYGGNIMWRGVSGATQTTFTGVFDGRNHRIYNIAFRGQNQRVGLVYQCNGTIKNVCIGSRDYDFETQTGTKDGYSNLLMDGASSTSTQWYYAGLIPYVQSGAKLENVVNFCDVTVDIKEETAIANNFRIGGIAGTMKGNTTLENCINFGDLTNNVRKYNPVATNQEMGGITSRFDGDGSSLISCVNKGTVTNNCTGCGRIGGVIATITKTSSVVRDCANEGDIIQNADCDADLNVGGVIAIMDGKTLDLTEATATTLRNSGNILIKGNADVQPEGAADNYYVRAGGIVAYIAPEADYVSYQKPYTIKHCVNSGSITVNADKESDAQLYIGGIVGTGSKDAIVSYENCSNAGALTVTKFVNTKSYYSYISGIAHSPYSVKSCSNRGDISCAQDMGKIRIGGIASLWRAKYVSSYVDKGGVITDCSVEANLTAADATTAMFVGGIVGSAVEGTNNGLVRCSYKGTITTGKCNNTAATGADVGGSVGGLMGVNYTFKYNNCSVNATIVSGQNVHYGLYAGGNMTASSRNYEINGACTVKSGSSLNGVSFTDDTQLSADSYKAVLGTRNGSYCNIVLKTGATLTIN